MRRTVMVLAFGATQVLANAHCGSNLNSTGATSLLGIPPPSSGRPVVLNPVVDDCSELPGLAWTVGGLLESSPLDPPGSRGLLHAGHSQKTGLLPLVDANCYATVASVEWIVDGGSIAAIAEAGFPPNSLSAWVIGLSPGEAQLRARLVFADGREAETPPERVRVEPFSPLGELLLSGTIVDPGEGNGWLNFDVPSSGRLHVFVGASAPIQDPLDVIVYEGTCDGGSCGGRFLDSASRDHNHRPMRIQSLPVSPGPHSLSAYGPPGEPVVFEIRLGA